MKQASVFVLLCCLAAIVPFRQRPSVPVANQNDGFPGWLPLVEWASQGPVETALSARERRFYDRFPGRVASFRLPGQQLILRWVKAPTRGLHPGSHCFRGSGYKVTPLPPELDGGRRWGRFEAVKGTEILLVRERIYESSGHQWTDVSAWYWAALLGRDKGPWWVVTHIETVPSSRTQL